MGELRRGAKRARKDKGSETGHRKLGGWEEGLKAGISKDCIPWVFYDCFVSGGNGEEAEMKC